MKNYGFSVFWSEEGRCYVATCPDFVGVSAVGPTAADALREIQIALARLLKDKGAGETWPEATTHSNCSGQIRLRMPTSLHQKLSLAAQREGVSLNQYMIYLLSENISADHIRKTLDQHLDHIKGAMDSGSKAIESAILTWSVKVQSDPVEYLQDSYGESDGKVVVSIN